MTYEIGFLKSALTEENPFIATGQVIEWIKERNRAVNVSVSKIPFGEMSSWFFDKDTGILKHISGKFFSIEGVHVKTNWGKVPEWEQPIINQPEIGYLGIITKEFNGILYFLLQAKIEPGNVNHVQLSPTLQATRSNYTRVHQGKKPLYLEYFQNASKDEIVLDQLQSEQGARFLRKRNRNIIIKIDGDITVYDDFIWLSLGQIKKLIGFDNIVNMDTRTVISGIPFGSEMNWEAYLEKHFTNAALIPNIDLLRSAIDVSGPINSFDEIIKWLTALKCRYDLELNPVSVFELNNWKVEPDQIHHKDNKFFRVIAADIQIDNREVQSWKQPLVEPRQEGLIAYIYKKINGVVHFIVQAKLECGNFDILEMAPTVQCLTGSYINSKDLPFLDYVLNVKHSQISFDTLQSEEGGRFFKEQNRNLIIEADENFPDELPENYQWVSLHQLNTFLKFNNYLNIQSRSLLSAISFVV